eukprot:2930369-Pyramimonas_sp.AAC.1
MCEATVPLSVASACQAELVALVVGVVLIEHLLNPEVQYEGICNAVRSFVGADLHKVQMVAEELLPGGEE